MSSVVPLRSSSCQSPDLVLPRPFPLCSRPGLLTKAAEGGLEPAPASRFRGADPHRSSSYTHWTLLGPLRSWRTIVGVADYNHVALRDFLSPYLRPQVEHMVQVHVGEQR